MSFNTLSQIPKVIRWRVRHRGGGDIPKLKGLLWGDLWSLWWYHGPLCMSIISWGWWREQQATHCVLQLQTFNCIPASRSSKSKLQWANLCLCCSMTHQQVQCEAWFLCKLGMGSQNQAREKRMAASLGCVQSWAFHLRSIPTLSKNDDGKSATN